MFKTKQSHKSTTCSVFPGYRASRILKVQLVAEVQVVVPGFIHQVTTAQATFDHLLLCHSSSQKLYGEQGEAHLKGARAHTLVGSDYMKLKTDMILHAVMQLNCLTSVEHAQMQTHKLN